MAGDDRAAALVESLTADLARLEGFVRETAG